MSSTFERIETILRGMRRGGTSDGDDKPIRVNQSDELLIAHGLPRFVEMARRYETQQVQTATLLAPLVAVPTTVAALELWVNISSTDTMIVESLFADQILSTAAAQEYAIYACVSLPKAIPTVTGLVVTNALGDNSGYTSAAGSQIVCGVGTTVVANGWRPYGPPHGGALAAATPMGSWEAPIDGRLIVRPGRALLLHIVGSLATASSFQVGAQFWMIPNETVSRK